MMVEEREREILRMTVERDIAERHYKKRKAQRNITGKRRVMIRQEL